MHTAEKAVAEIVLRERNLQKDFDEKLEIVERSGRRVLREQEREKVREERRRLNLLQLRNHTQDMSATGSTHH